MFQWHPHNVGSCMLLYHLWWHFDYGAWTFISISGSTAEELAKEIPTKKRKLIHSEAAQDADLLVSYASYLKGSIHVYVSSTDLPALDLPSMV